MDNALLQRLLLDLLRTYDKMVYEFKVGDYENYGYHLNELNETIEQIRNYYIHMFKGGDLFND